MSAFGCSAFFVISAACTCFVGCARLLPLKFSAIFSGLLNRNLAVSIFAFFSLFDSTFTFLAYVVLVLVLVLVFVFAFAFLGILKSPFTSFSFNGVVSQTEAPLRRSFS